MSNGEPVPDDEPLFILRGRDRLAIPDRMKQPGITKGK